MSRRKKKAGHVSHERWLVSYADFITLLFAFFVVLFASSQVDQRKAGRMAMAIQVAFQEMGIFTSSNASMPLNSSEPMPLDNVQIIENAIRTADLGKPLPSPQGTLGRDGSANRTGDLRKPEPSPQGTPGGNGSAIRTPDLGKPLPAPQGTPGRRATLEDLKDIQKDLQRVLAEEIARHVVNLELTREGLVISLREVGFFDSGSATLRAQAEPPVFRLAKVLAGYPHGLRIEGHTDNVPIHTARFASNWELSTTRATEMIKLFITRYSFTPGRLSAAGYAEFHPVTTNDKPEGRAFNRRLDVVVLAPPAEAAPEPNPPSSAGARSIPKKGSP